MSSSLGWRTGHLPWTGTTVTRQRSPTEIACPGSTTNTSSRLPCLLSPRQITANGQLLREPHREGSSPSCPSWCSATMLQLVLGGDDCTCIIRASAAFNTLLMLVTDCTPATVEESSAQCRLVIWAWQNTRETCHRLGHLRINMMLGKVRFVKYLWLGFFAKFLSSYLYSYSEGQFWCRKNACRRLLAWRCTRFSYSL